MTRAVKIWGNVIAYELVWLASVWGAGRGTWWVAPLALLPFAAWYLSRAGGAADARLMLACALTGIVMDSLLALSGLLTYAAPFPLANAAPIWIVCMWASFGLTIRHSLKYLQHRPVLALVLGGIGGPLAYLGAARGWHAVAFPQGALPAMAALGLAWAIALPCLFARAASLEAAARAKITSAEHLHVA